MDYGKIEYDPLQEMVGVYNEKSEKEKGKKKYTETIVSIEHQCIINLHVIFVKVPTLRRIIWLLIGKHTHLLQCCECNKSSRYKHVIVEHIRLKHSVACAEEVLFHCEFRAKRRQDLKKQVNAMHLGQVYPCQDCEHQFNDQSNLRRHVKIVHSKFDDFVCVSCGKLFSRAHNLKRHMAVHDIQVSCEVCEKQFISRHKLKMHLVGVNVPKVGFNCPFMIMSLPLKKMRPKRHIRENHKVYPCQFNDQSNLRRHVKIVHSKIADFVCVHSKDGNHK